MADYLSKAVAFAENAAKLTQKVGEGIVENAREFGFDAHGGGSAYFDTSEDKMRDIRRQLDSRNDREKLDGLKKLIAMISKGRDVREFFPDVVKNVASQNIEIRKLVYIYVLRYAEQEPDLALLSINTFQKDLTDQNQLIRAMALRVMSSIRVPVISPIVMLGIKKCITDSSPYVRKTAAHAIVKCNFLDPSQKDELIDVIQKLLGDTSTITIGSVIQALQEVCPDRLDLIHPVYRKLCRMLVDTDEWGQIAIVSLLTRYARTQFLKPKEKNFNLAASNAKRKSSFYSSSDTESESNSKRSITENSDSAEDIDPDFSLLLKCTAPLLNSRNSGVILTVTKLYYHLAPAEERAKTIKPLLRLLRSHRELQFVVLTNIAVICSTEEGRVLFAHHMSAFFVRPSDPAFVRDLKLEILTLVVNENNIQVLLKELREYVKSPNKDFVTSTIQAIGRCAMRLPAVADNCLKDLMKMLYNKNDAVVAESVIVIKRLLQLNSAGNSSTILKLARAFDQIKVPMARASILWLIGQYAESMPDVGPDVLRKAAKEFTTEADVTKLQILTLSAKLITLSPSHPTLALIFQYVLNLARYDLNYDVRDRARFLRGLIISSPVTAPASINGSLSSSSSQSILHQHAKRILLSEKEVPLVVSPSASRERFTLGSLSLLLNYQAQGYDPLPDWPTEKPDPSVRDVEEPAGMWGGTSGVKIERGFGSDDFGFRYGQAASSTGWGGSKERAGRVVPKKVEYDLEAFYNETESEEEEEDDDDEETEEESAGSSSETSDEDEENEDESSEENKDDESDEDEEEDEEEEEEDSDDNVNEKSNLMSKKR